MIKKNSKIASWSLGLSIATLLIVSSSLLVTYTDIGKNMSFFNISNIKSELEASYLKIDKLIQEKDLLMQQLKDQLKEFEELKVENDSLKYQLEAKNQKVDELFEKIESLEKDVSNLMSLKKELATAIKQNEIKVTQNIPVEDYKVETVNNQKHTIQKATIVDSFNATTSSKKAIINNSPVREIIRNEEEEVRLLNSSVRTFYIKNSGDRKLTNNINKVNTIQLEYTLFKDKSSNKISNTFYVQIFDTNNKNIGNTQSVVLDGKELIYSFLSKVENDKAINNIKEEFAIKDLNLFKGMYFLNIFSETGKLLSTRSFKLE